MKEAALIGSLRQTSHVSGEHEASHPSIARVARATKRFEAVILAVYEARGGVCQKVALRQPIEEKTGH